MGVSKTLEAHYLLQTSEQGLPADAGWFGQMVVWKGSKTSVKYFHWSVYAEAPIQWQHVCLTLGLDFTALSLQQTNIQMHSLTNFPASSAHPTISRRAFLCSVRYSIRSSVRNKFSATFCPTESCPRESENSLPVRQESLARAEDDWHEMNLAADWRSCCHYQVQRACSQLGWDGLGHTAFPGWLRLCRQVQ